MIRQGTSPLQVQDHMTFINRSTNVTPSSLVLVLTITLLLACATLPTDAQTGGDTGPHTVEIEAQSGLTYSPMRFRVDPGQTLRLVLKNTDRLLHNMLITKPGKRLDVVNSAMKLGAAGQEKNYVPDSENVLWNIRILDEGEQSELVFEAPENEGVYPYVCTLPGHGFTMYGAMYVREENDLPPVSEDPHLPDKTSEGSASAGLLDPLPDRARVYREFLPDASPAAIAVALPAGGSSTPFSYCFDAARCQIRYAWSGGFIDVPYRRGDVAEIDGSVFYRNTAGFPLRFGSKKAQPGEREFLGYNLDSGVPEFRYRTGTQEVRQIVTLRPDGPGIVQQFHLPDVQQPVWFVSDYGDEARLKASDGSWQDGTLKLTPEEATSFSVTIIPNHSGDASSTDRTKK